MDIVPWDLLLVPGTLTFFMETQSSSDLARWQPQTGSLALVTHLHATVRKMTVIKVGRGCGQWEFLSLCGVWLQSLILNEEENHFAPRENHGEADLGPPECDPGLRRV